MGLFLFLDQYSSDHGSQSLEAPQKDILNSSLSNNTHESNLLEDPEKRIHRSPSFPDSTTSPSLIGKSNGNPKTSTCKPVSYSSSELISKPHEPHNSASLPTWKENSNMQIKQ